ncbi:MAG: response regulator transcription factor [Planctomycetes bacterium]|nr:response regulator transcription factor [Planctomycetota bacterium]
MTARAKILLVDDDQDLVAVLHTVLEKADYEVFSALSGAEGLAQARTQKPDLIILDVMLETEHTGFQVCRELKSDPSLRHVPVLFLSCIRTKKGGWCPRGCGVEGMAADDFADKPIRPSDLLARVQNLLQRRPGPS